MSRAMPRLFLRLAAALVPSIMTAIASPAFSVDTDKIARGKYIAVASDCVACHTAPGGAAMAGGLPVVTPVGVIVATNITPSRDNGIGNYSLEQFDAALRRGVRADGRHLYPAMPYTSYSLLTDDDVAALYAYYMHDVTPVETRPPETKLPFPFNIRLSMAAEPSLPPQGSLHA